jgi:hypothetical protein
VMRTFRIDATIKIIDNSDDKKGVSNSRSLNIWYPSNR